MASKKPKPAVKKKAKKKVVDKKPELKSLVPPPLKVSTPVKVEPKPAPTFSPPKVLEPIKPLSPLKEVIIPPKPKVVKDFCKREGKVSAGFVKGEYDAEKVPHQNHSVAFRCSDVAFMEKVYGPHVDGCAHVGFVSATKCGCNK